MREFRFSKKWLLFLLLPIAIALVINSCKKQDQQSSQQGQQARTDELSAIKQRLDRDGLTYTIPVNQKLDAYFVDKAGNRVPDSVLKRTASGTKTADAITSACDYSNTPSSTFNSYTVTSVCTSGFTIAWNYTVSSNNNIVLVNSTTSATSKGQVKIYNSSNSQVYSATPLATSVTDNGADPSNPGYELFTVAITSASIPFSNFANGNTVKLGAVLVTDCPDVEAFSIAIVPYSINANGGALANSCDRLDPIQVAQSTAPLRFYGEDPVGVCASGFVYPQLQEIQYQVDDSTAWIGETPSASLSYVLPPSSIAVYDSILNKHLGYVDPYGALELNIAITPSGAHTVKVRYRNIMFNNPLSSYPGSMWPVPVFGANGNCCVGPWSAITTYTVTY